jgi:hypothetical protein
MRQQNPHAKLNKDNFVINLKQYYRQYVPFLNEKGEKEVWVNCFCSSLDNDWRKDIIYVHDGGNCFFQLRVNLSKGTYHEFSVNGEA